MSTADWILSSTLRGEALLAARRPELRPLIDHLAEQAQGRDNIRTECAGVIAGAWFATPARRGEDLVAAGLLMLAGHIDLDQLNRWVRVGWERARGASLLYPGDGEGMDEIIGEPDDALHGKSPDAGKLPGMRLRPSERVSWWGPVGLFWENRLLVTTQRVMFNHGDSSFTVLRLSEIDTVEVSHVELSITSRGVTHRLDFRKNEVAKEVARKIEENMILPDIED
jgi:hypothetical protein